MDLKALLQKAGVPSVAKPEIVQPVNNLPEPAAVADSMCECGHLESAHCDTGECETLGCECGSFYPSSEAYDINPDKSPKQVQNGTCSEIHEVPVVGTPLLQAEATGEGLVSAVVEPAPTIVPAIKIQISQLKDLPSPSDDLEADFTGFCQHLCDCGKWWTHGVYEKCRYPDMLKQGKCQDCLSGKTDQIKPEGDYEHDKNGNIKLTKLAEVKVRNAELSIVQNMSIEQITAHIEFYALRIEELRIASLISAKHRRELEEEECANIPESEREAFIQELRKGAAAKTARVKKEKKAKDPALLTGKAKETALISQLTTAGKTLPEAKVIAAMMIRTGKSQAEVEAWLND